MSKLRPVFVSTHIPTPNPPAGMGRHHGAFFQVTAGGRVPIGEGPTGFCPPVEGARGTTLIAGVHGVFSLSLDRSQLTQIPSPITWPLALAYDEGAIYLGTSNGLHRLGESGAHFKKKDGLIKPATTLLQSTPIGLLVGTQGGVSVLADRAGPAVVLKKRTNATRSFAWSKETGALFTDYLGIGVWDGDETTVTEAAGPSAIAALPGRRAGVLFEGGAPQIFDLDEQSFEPWRALSGVAPVPTAGAQGRDGRFFALAPEARILYEISGKGELSKTYELGTADDGTGHDDFNSISVTTAGVWIVTNAKYRLELFAL